MRDLNFFEEYIEKREFKINKKIVSIIVSSFLILSLITYTIYNAIIIKQETLLVNKLKLTAEDPRTVEKVAEIVEKELEVGEFRESVEKIRQLDRSIEERDIINEAFLEEITSKMPKDLFFTSLSIYNDIQIVGISKDKWAVAELEKGLQSIDKVEDVFISNISLAETDYNFTINITLKDVSLDGEEATNEGEDEI